MSTIIRKFIPAICSECKGTGYVDKPQGTAKTNKCLLCNGTGKVEIREEVEITPDRIEMPPTKVNPIGTNPWKYKPPYTWCEFEPYIFTISSDEFDTPPQWDLWDLHENTNGDILWQ